MPETTHGQNFASVFFLLLKTFSEGLVLQMSWSNHFGYLHNASVGQEEVVVSSHCSLLALLKVAANHSRSSKKDERDYCKFTQFIAPKRQEKTEGPVQSE